MDCLPLEVALAVLEGDQEEAPWKVEISSNLLSSDTRETFDSEQPRKVAVREELREEQGNLAGPKLQPHLPPPPSPPALPLSLSAGGEPPAPPPFMPAMAPPQQPAPPAMVARAPPPASLPPSLPPALPVALRAHLPPPFAPSVPVTTAPVGPASAPPLPPQGFASEMISGGTQGLSCGAVTCTPVLYSPIRRYQPLRSVLDVGHHSEQIPHAGRYFQTPQSTEPPLEATNPGSALHGTGNCHPCAWFWKLPGCRDGANCNHCHLCPEGEVKARKRVRQAMKRMGLATPQKTGSTRSLEFTPSTLPGTPHSSELESTACSFSDREFAAGSASEQEAAGDSDREDSAAPPAPVAAEGGAGMLRLPPGLQPPADVPSRGSVLHNFGGCSPCAWYWKLVGCNNGRDCEFCHACPQGAVKARKKALRAKAAGAGDALAAVPAAAR